MADAVALVGRVSVARVLPPALADRAQVGLDLRPRRVEQWAKESAVPEPGAAETGKTHATAEPQQERLHLIVGSVRGGDEVRARASGGLHQEPAAQAPEPFLPRPAEPSHALARVPSPSDERQAQALAELDDEALIAIGLVTPQAVMEVRGDDVDAELAGQPVQ